MGCDRNFRDKEGGGNLCKRGTFSIILDKLKDIKRWVFTYTKRGGIVEIKGLSERVAVLKLDMTRGKVITIIQVYAPTNMATKL